MKKKRHRGNASGVHVPRKRHVASNTDNGSDSNNSSWIDVDDDDDVATELQEHKQNLNEFCVNVVSFLNKFQDSVMIEISAGRIAPAIVNGSLEKMKRKITTVLSRLNRSRVTEATPYDDNATSRFLDARETEVDALYERIVQVLGAQCLLRGNGTGNVAVVSSSPAKIVCTSLQSPLGVFDTCSQSVARSEGTFSRLPSSGVIDTPVRSLSADRSTRGDELNNLGLPSFLAALKPKYTDKAKRCRECGADKSLLPTYWSDSFHRTLHRLRAAIPLPTAFVARDGPAIVLRTVHAANFHYHVLKIRPDRYDDTCMRSVREYVDAELGVSERGIQRSNRTAYVSVALRGHNGPAIAVIGYLEVEPLTAIVARVYVLDVDGHLSQTHHRGRSVKYGISRIWVAIGYRRRRVGTNMLNEFRVDHSLSAHDVAFATHEIQLGDAFVRHYIDEASTLDGDDTATIFIYTNSPLWYNIQQCHNDH